MSEINVTPLVDVMLVLLIVFMVAAPLMTVGVPIELPKTEAKQLDSSTEPITITVRADRSLFLQDSAVAADQLTASSSPSPRTAMTSRSSCAPIPTSPMAR